MKKSEWVTIIVVMIAIAVIVSLFTVNLTGQAIFERLFNLNLPVKPDVPIDEPYIKCYTDKDCPTKEDFTPYCDGNYPCHLYSVGSCENNRCVYTKTKSCRKTPCAFGCDHGFCLESNGSTGQNFADHIHETLVEDQEYLRYINGKLYRLSVNSFGDNSVKLVINGESTSSLRVGYTFKLSDGRYVKIDNLFISQVSGNPSSVQILLI